MAQLLDYSKPEVPPDFAGIIHALAIALSLPACFHLLLYLVGILSLQYPAWIPWLLTWAFWPSLLTVVGSTAPAAVLFGRFGIGWGLWSTGFCMSINTITILLTALVCIMP